MVFNHTYRIGLEDCGKENEATNKAILTILEDIAGLHSATVGLGLNEINKTGCAWVILKWQVQIIKRPEYNDELNVFDENMRAICKAAAKVRTPFRHTTQEQIREAMKEKKNARKLVEQYAPTRELDVMAIVARNQLVEKQFTEGEHTKTIENINPVLSENSKILEESTKQRRTSREENLLGKLMEASNQ